MIDFKKVKLIIWDLDETLWEGTLSDNDSIRLRNEFIQFIHDSLDRGIVHSICSKNETEATRQRLVSLGIWDLFVFPSINWSPKGERIRLTIEQMKLRAENVVFVDDNVSNLNEASYYCPELKTYTPSSFLNTMGSVYAIKNVDASRPRLSQYRLLEEKSNAERTFSSNEEFLMSCNIRVSVAYDCAKNIERIHDLIMRSNQLNYTKFRQDKHALLADLTSESTEAAYITVKDAYGDYGIVGFYMIAEGKVKHFLFSCRTLGMLVEQYVYMQIGCPEIHVAGDVVTELNKTDIPPWINQEKECTNNRRAAAVCQRVLFKGPCDINQIFSFIQENENVTTEFTYVDDKGVTVEGYNHTAQIVTALTCSDAEKSKLLHSTPWLSEKMLNATAWRENDIIVFSVLIDGNLGVYQHKETGHRISLCESYYDLTDEKNRDAYINKRIYTSDIDFTAETLRDFSHKFRSVDNNRGDVTMSNLDILYANKRKTAKLILLLGSEVPFLENKNPAYSDRHIFNRMLNAKIKKWAEDKEDVYLIEMGKYIASQKDFTNSINHFQKRVYYHIAQDILKILGSEQTPLKIKGKGFAYFTIIRNVTKRFIKKILKKS